MKILLIRPPSEVKYANIPIGLLYIAAYIRKNQNHEIGVLDARVKKMSFDQIKNEIKKQNPDVVGIGYMTIEAPPAHKIAKIVKSIKSNCKVIVGGPHPTGAVDDELKDLNIDFVVLGEGEVTMNELIEKINEPKYFRAIKGIAYRENGEIIKTPPREFIEDLDSLPFPAYDLIDLNEYFKATRMIRGERRGHHKYVGIFTTRGCPFGCIYCHNIFGRKFRVRSCDNVLKEIKLLVKKYGVKQINIEDDSFNVNMKRAKKICDVIIKSKLDIKISFPNGVRIDFIDRELLEKFKKAGVFWISYGIESASPRIQKIIRKGLDLSKVKERITLTESVGIHTHGFFMLGFPTETKKEMLQTIEFARSSDLSMAGFKIVVPFPGTYLNQLLISQGYKLSKDYSVYKQPETFVPPKIHWTDQDISGVSNDELVKIQKKAYISFYFPKRIFSHFINSGNKLELLKRSFKEFLISGLSVLLR